MPSTTRRRAAFGLIVAAPIPVAIGFFASANPGRYVYLDWLAHPYLAIALSLGMLGLAGRLALRRGALRVGAQSTAALLTVLVLLAGLGVSMAADPFEPVRGEVVASSSGYRVVGYEVMGLVAGLRVQTRAGLLSREAGHDVACFSWSSSDSPRSELFGRVTFVGRNEIEVVTEDGQASRVRFDPQTLAAEDTIDRLDGWCEHR